MLRSDFVFRASCTILCAICILVCVAIVWNDCVYVLYSV